MVGHKLAAAAVGAGYVASEVFVRANLANLKPHEVYLGLNAVSIAALALLRSRGLFATALRVSFALRVASFLAFELMKRPDLNAFDAMTRWDSIAAAAGVVLVVAALFRAFFPGSSMRWAYELAFLAVAIPLVAILPKLFDLPRVHHPTLVRGALESARASQVPRGDVYDEKTDTSVVFTDDGDTLFVGFNATRSPANVATDKDVRSKNIGEWVSSSSGAEPRVHSGFGNAFDTVRAGVLARVWAWARAPLSAGQESKFARVPAGRRVVFVGHSLGGAHATIAGLVVARALSAGGMGPGSVRVDVYTYGAPAVGDGTFATMFNETVGVSVRVADPLDPVPRVSGTQFVHVRGYYPVSVPKIALKGIPNHGIARYTEGITGSKTSVALGMLMPLGLALAALTPLIGADVFLAHRRFSRAVAAVASG